MTQVNQPNKMDFQWLKNAIEEGIEKGKVNVNVNQFNNDGNVTFTQDNDGVDQKYGPFDTRNRTTPTIAPTVETPIPSEVATEGFIKLEPAIAAKLGLGEDSLVTRDGLVYDIKTLGTDPHKYLDTHVYKVPGTESMTPQQIATKMEGIARTGALPAGQKLEPELAVTGDPHLGIDVNNDGTIDAEEMMWAHFKGDSTIATRGTKGFYDTEKWMNQENARVTKNLTLVSGDQIVTIGVDKPLTVEETGGREWAANHGHTYGDNKDDEGVMTLLEDGTLAARSPNGLWYPMKQEDWHVFFGDPAADPNSAAFKGDPDIELDLSKGPIALDKLPAAAQADLAGDLLAQNWDKLPKNVQQMFADRAKILAEHPAGEEAIEEAAKELGLEEPEGGWRKQFEDWNDMLAKGEIGQDNDDFDIEGQGDVMAIIFLVMMKARRQSKQKLLASANELQQNTAAQKGYIGKDDKSSKAELDKLSLDRQDLQSKMQIESGELNEIQTALSQLMKSYYDTAKATARNLG